MKKNDEKKNNLMKILFIIIIILLLGSVITNIFLLNEKKDKKSINIDENIVFFGDSITEGYEVKKYYPNRDVINSGRGGNRSEDLINRIENDVYIYNPSKVFLLVGINDMCVHIDDADILYNIQTIINGIKSNRKNAKIYVESIYPTNTKKMLDQEYDYCSDMDNKRIREINKKIKELCIESDVTYIDVYGKLVDKEGYLKELYTKEGLHLNNLGYLKVTSVLDKYVEE